MHFELSGPYERLDNSLKFIEIIQNEEIEEEARIRHAKAIKISSIKCFFFPIISIISLGLIYLLQRWKMNWKIRLRMSYCDLNEASHLYITGIG